ncbi:MAG: hypothetical protein QRY74_01130 [Chlamydia sp.]
MPVNRIQNKRTKEMTGIASQQSPIKLLNPLLQDTLTYAHPISSTGSVAAKKVSMLPNAASSNDLKIQPDLTQHPAIKNFLDESRFIAEKSPIEPLFFSIMMELFENSKDFMEVQKKLIEGQTEIRDRLHKELFKAQESHNERQKISDTVSTITQISGPIALMVAGAVAIATGGVSIFAAAAISMGGLTLLDTLFDDIAKRQAAEWLSKTTNETIEEWMGRIYLASQVASFAMTMGLPNANILKLIKSVSDIGLKTVEAGNQILENRIKATLTELGAKIDRSKNTLDQYTTSFSDSTKVADDLTQSIFSTMNSMRQTGSMIR